MGFNFSANDLVDAVRKVANENPTRVDPYSGTGGSRYFDGERPSCLIGWALYSLGVTAEDAREYNHEGIEDLCIEHRIIRRSDWLANVQIANDIGYKWLDAVSTADNLIGD